MSLSLRGVRNGALVLVLLAIPLALLRGYVLRPHELTAFDRAVRRIGAPLEAAMAYSSGMLGALFERWVLQAKVQDENDELRRETRDLRLRLRDLARIEEENAELRRSLAMRARVPEDLLAAELIGVDQSPFYRVVSVRLDRGDAFVAAGMAVVAPDGVVGRIDRAFDEYSDVLLMTDPRSKIAVEVARTHAQGILEGSGEDRCTVKISKDFEVQIGDIVQTSGIDDLFPPGHPVGQVVAVEPMVGDEQRLAVLPAVRFDRLEAVWVVLSAAPDPDPWAQKSPRPGLARGLQAVN